MIASPDLIDRVIVVYAFKPEDKRQLANALAKGYLLAKAQSYQHAQAKAGHVVHIRKPWQVSEIDVTKAQSWSMKQVESIAETYETLLRHEIESLPEERALGDLIVKAKQAIAAIGDWVAGFLPWKTKQIADNTWNTGDNDGTNQWVGDALSSDTEGDTSIIRVQIQPGESSNDFCKQYAGEEYSLAEYRDLGVSFPAHPNCIHSAIIITLEDVGVSRSVVQSDLVDGSTEDDATLLFLDLDGVFSIPNADLHMAEIDGKEAWPIPQANAILQAINHDNRYKPIWLTHWGKKANEWNDRAGIERWPVNYPLSEQQETEANHIYPDLNKKALAIQYCMHQLSTQSGIWIQDGFAPEEQEWAEDALVMLIDTNKEPLHSLLLSDQAGMVSDFIDSLERVTA